MALLQVGRRADSICRLIDRKHLPAHRDGRLRKFKLSEVDEWARAVARMTPLAMMRPLRQFDWADQNRIQLHLLDRIALGRAWRHLGRPGVQVRSLLSRDRPNLGLAPRSLRDRPMTCARPFRTSRASPAPTSCTCGPSPRPGRPPNVSNNLLDNCPGATTWYF